MRRLWALSRSWKTQIWSSGEFCIGRQVWEQLAGTGQRIASGTFPQECLSMLLQLFLAWGSVHSFTKVYCPEDCSIPFSRKLLDIPNLLSLSLPILSCWCSALVLFLWSLYTVFLVHLITSRFKLPYIIWWVQNVSYQHRLHSSTLKSQMQLPRGIFP